MAGTTLTLLRALVTLVALASGAAFVPNKVQHHAVHQPQVVKKTTALYMSRGGGLRLGIGQLLGLKFGKATEVFKGVGLPPTRLSKRIRNLFNLNLYSNKETLSFIIRSNSLKIENEKKNSLREAEQMLQQAADLPKNVPKEDYRYFGDEDNRAKELALILKTNPFFTSALTEKVNGFELKSYDPDEKNPSRYLQYIRTLNGVGHRVNFEFNKNMEIVAFTYFDDAVGTPIKGNLNDEELLQSFACSAIYNLLFYASGVHATIHVLHYLLTNAFEDSARNFKQMDKWARWYSKSINLKYLEVGLLLINDPPEDDKQDNTIITGPGGFGSSQEIRPMLKDLLDSWGQGPTCDEFFDNMMNISRAHMEEAGILTEFFKHFDLAKEFAADASDALRSINKNKFKDAEADLKDYLKRCGKFKSNINTIEEWLQLMAVTGIVHGGTLSYSRYIGTASVVRWRNVQSDKWDAGDENLIKGGLGTITGMDPGRHVMSSEDGKYSRKLQNVLDQYDADCTALKKEYEKKLIASKDLEDYGFILSDFCTDDFDGKQLTVTTYI